MTPMIEFIAPWRLWWLLLVPLVAVLYFALTRRLVLPPGHRRSSRLDRVLPRDRPWKRHLSVAAALLSLAALVVAFAQPKDHQSVPRDRATVIVAIDVSRSMMAQDVKPDRLVAAQDAARAFVQSLPPRFNVGLVTFAGTARAIVPPVTDRGAVIRAINSLRVAPSTAIGEGIYKSLDDIAQAPIDPAQPDTTAPAAIVLLSDGATNIGRSSARAARDARDQDVPVYTIAYGTPGGYVVEAGVRQPVPVNHKELADVAQISGGKKFSAASARDLTEVYSSIAQAIGTEKVFTEVTERYAGYALLFAVIAALGVISLGARWP